MQHMEIAGFSRLDALDLEATNPDAEVSFRDAALMDPAHGELTTVAIVALTLAGMKLLSAWLLKKRSSTVITRDITFVDENGNERTESLHVDISNSDAPDKDVLEALAGLANVDLTTLS